MLQSSTRQRWKFPVPEGGSLQSLAPWNRIQTPAPFSEVYGTMYRVAVECYLIAIHFFVLPYDISHLLQGPGSSIGPARPDDLLSHYLPVPAM